MDQVACCKNQVGCVPVRPDLAYYRLQGLFRVQAQQTALAVGKQVGISDLQDLYHLPGPGMLGDYLHSCSQVVDWLPEPSIRHVLHPTLSHA